MIKYKILINYKIIFLFSIILLNYLKDQQLMSEQSPYSSIFSDLINIKMKESYYEIQKSEEDPQNLQVNALGKETESLYKIQYSSEKKLKNTQMNVGDLKKITQTQTSKISDLNKQISTIKGGFSKWCQIKQERDAEINRKSLYIDQLLREIEDKDKRIQQLIQQNDSNRSQVSNQKQLSAELKRRKETEQELVKLNLSLGAENEQLKNIIQELEVQNEDLFQKLKKYQVQIANLPETINCGKIKEKSNQQFINSNQSETLKNIENEVVKYKSYLSLKCQENIQITQKLSINEEQLRILKVKYLNLEIQYKNSLMALQTKELQLKQKISQMQQKQANLKSQIIKQNQIIIQYERNQKQNAENSEKKNNEINKILKTCQGYVKQISLLSQKYLVLMKKIQKEQVQNKCLREQYSRCQQKIFSFLLLIHDNEQKALKYLKNGNDCSKKQGQIVPNFPSLANFLVDIFKNNVCEYLLHQIKKIISENWNQFSQQNNAITEQFLFNQMRRKFQKFFKQIINNLLQFSNSHTDNL